MARRGRARGIVKRGRGVTGAPSQTAGATMRLEDFRRVLIATTYARVIAALGRSAAEGSA